MARYAMKTPATVALASILIVTAVGASAQMGPLTPAPELKKLDYSSASWAREATIGQGPWGQWWKIQRHRD